MPVIPATQDAEAGELPEPEGGGSGEPTSRHCTPAWVTRAKLCLKKKKKDILKMVKIAGRGRWLASVIPALWEAKVSGSQGQEIETILVNMVKPRLY